MGGLNANDDGDPITTVLFHRDSLDPTPWDGREADEVRSLGSSPSNDEIVASLRQADIDTLWLGAWSPTERADLIEACEAVGIEVVGPDSATVRRLADADVRRGLPGGSGQLDADAPVHRIDIDVLADAHGTVWRLDTVM